MYSRSLAELIVRDSVSAKSKKLNNYSNDLFAFGLCKVDGSCFLNGVAGKIPKDWTNADAVLLHKKGDTIS